MDEIELFKLLRRQTKDTLLDLLYEAYGELKTYQRNDVFGEIISKSKPKKVVAKTVIENIRAFHEESMSGVYYAPFNINSKNFSHVPEETDRWFDILGDLLNKSMQLLKQKEYAHAVDCFGVLYELIDQMDDGEEIVFADEIGSWMIPIDEKKCIESYILSLSKIMNPEDYTQKVIPLIERDSYMSFCGKVYSQALKHGTKEQSLLLKETVKEQGIRVE